MHPGVVWLASYPKSGNTWFRLLLSNWRRNGDSPADINALVNDGEDLLQRESFDGATLLCGGLLRPPERDRLRPAVNRYLAGQAETARFIKVHDAYTRNGDGDPVLGRDVARAVLYFIRDPRDVAVSFAAHTGVSTAEAVRAMLDPKTELAGDLSRQWRQFPQRLLSWSGHVNSWTRQRDLPVHIVRYEDLLAHTEEVFARALDFLGEPRDPDRLARAVRHSCLAEAQRQELRQGFRERLSPDVPFFRQGRSGGWRTALSTDLADRIESSCSLVMLRYGYLGLATHASGSG